MRQGCPWLWISPAGMLSGMQPNHQICYLCGKPLAAPTSRDHVPPKQFFANDIRKSHNLSKLLTLEVHAACNHGHHLDEDYFVASLSPLALESFAGSAVVRDSVARVDAGKSPLLLKKVLGEFSKSHGRIVLPSGLVAKRIEGERIERTCWKIIRGLYFHHQGLVLPEALSMSFWIWPPHEKPGEQFFLLQNEPVHGAYPGVFDYKFKVFAGPPDICVWSLLLWDKLILLTAFELPLQPREGEEAPAPPSE